MPGSIVSIRPDDLSVYGLDVPSRLTMSLGDWSGTILIGRRDAEQGGRYVMLEGYDAVLLDVHGDYSFLDVSFSQLRASLIWLHNISDVSSVTFEMDGITRILRFEHSNSDDSLRGWLDDVEISDTNARRLYIAGLNITQSGETDSPIPANDIPVYTVTMNMTNGSKEAIELYRLNDSQFLIVLNGESTSLFITRMALQQNLLSRFDIIDAGGELPIS